MALWDIAIVLSLAAARLLAGGSGLNVAVVVNQNSTNSVQLGNYYCEQRRVPPQNVLRIHWPGSNVEWSQPDFETYLVNPLAAMLSTRLLTNQIDYVLLSMDIPTRVIGTNGVNSTTSALFYGFKADDPSPDTGTPESCSLPAASSNAYAGSESVFRSTPPGDPGSNSWLVLMVTASNLAQAKAIIDHGVSSDGTFATQSVILGKSGDVFRNIRYVTFDNGIFNTRLRGNCSVLRTNAESPYSFANLLGYQNGHYQFSILTNAFVPGAMADSLTSYGGRILEPNDHTTLLAFLNAGASGSYGTVIEPCNYVQKFPSAQNYFYQSRGFSLAECYYQSVTNPYQGLLVGEPLAAPFALAPAGSWSNLPPNACLAGNTNLSLQFAAGDSAHPIQQVDLFLNGAWAQTLTNIAPCEGNILYVAINGQPTSYTVPAAANIASVASNLAAVLNTPAYAGTAKVRAFAHGDRLELQSLDLARPGAQIPITVSNSIGAATVLTTFISASGTNFLDTIACGARVNCLITNTPQVGDYLQFLAIKTNGQTVTVSLTNTASGTTLSQFAWNLFNAVNSNPALQSADGVAIEDIIMHEDWAAYGVYPSTDHSGEFSFRARSPGWAASQIQVCLAGSSTFIIEPSGTNRLDGNVNDLRPRSHLYLTAGVTNLALTFPFGTTAYAEGCHDLTAVVYDGSHVRTQKRFAQTIRIQNTSLTAAFTSLVGDTNTALEAVLQFSVIANTSNVTRIELFSTGGLLASLTNQSSATFSVAGTNLDLGLHPFHALVTCADGRQYHTETKWIRLVGMDFPFALRPSLSPLTLTWPAAAGRRYDILSATNISGAFRFRATVSPSNSTGIWAEDSIAAPQHFYRVRVSP